MTTSIETPFRVAPRLVEKVWGGRRLERFGKALPGARRIGESWEIYHGEEGGGSRILDGPLAGAGLDVAVREASVSLFGAASPPKLPFWVKLIEAAEWLSVQVHPGPEAACREGCAPKDEGWYILEADEGAKLVLGLRKGTDSRALEASLAAVPGSVPVPSLLRFVEARADAFVPVPAGTIHAIGPGIVLYEIQQPGGTTFRFHDWGRLGLDGKPRDLHVRQALESAVVTRAPELRAAEAAPAGRATILDGPGYRLDRVQLRAGDSMSLEGGIFKAATVVRGGAKLRSASTSLDLACGETAVIPAAARALSLQASGSARVLLAMAGNSRDDRVVGVINGP